ncbi:Hsp20/alpha crystallin family protein [Niabella soli]|uniref:Heat shock protein Hsp20 n=1 Tax=Niabella soli DSM 19437 TaxID=929713 RepID=W0EWJ7_9BACT|nr:Hsp20/alpha crystallin family protein [Niabella soli]AHF15155.1 heat shock protein Hsp20 [Niabella soli DSM 19437]
MYTNQPINESAQSPFGKHFKQCGGFWGRKFSEGNPWGHKLHQFMNNRKAVNIEETDAAYIVALYAAGLKKEHFKISIHDEVLTIRYALNEPGNDARYIYQEHQAGPFERSFKLNNKVLTDNVNAVYEEGVLKVTLTKNPETTKPAQEVNIL